MKHPTARGPGWHRAAAGLVGCALAAHAIAGQIPADSATDPPLPEAESPCFVIEHIEVQGDEVPRFGWLLDALTLRDGRNGPLRRCLGAEGIRIVVQRAQRALVARGFVTSRVLVEPQQLADGRLRLSVIPGRIRQVRFAGPAARHPSVFTALPARPGDVLDLRDVEQALENLRRVPTVEADIEIVPGDDPGLSDLLVHWTQQRPLRLELSVDDSGSRDTGRYRGNATLGLHNPLALNDSFQIGLQRGPGGDTPGRRHTRGHSWHYSLPWGRALLALDVSRHRADQTVAGASQNYVYRGASASQEATVSWMLHRDAAHKTTLHARAFAWRSTNHINDTELTVQRRRVGGWQAGLGHRALLDTGTFELGLTYQRGTGAFGSLPAPEDAFGEGTSRFGVVKASAEGVLPLPLMGHPWTYRTQWRAQVHRTPLSAAERFAIGGRHTVRGFDGEYSLSAESGWSWRNELSTPLGETGVSVFAGLDHGQVRGPSTDLLVGTRLTGAVVGLRHCPCAPGALQFELFAGWPLHKPDGFPTARTTLGFWLAATY